MFRGQETDGGCGPCLQGGKQSFPSITSTRNFVCDLRKVAGSLWVFMFPSKNKRLKVGELGDSSECAVTSHTDVA